MNRLKWAFFRILFIFTSFLCGITGGLIAYLFAPVTSYLMFNDPDFIKYHKRFIPIAGAFWSRLYALITDKNYRGMMALSLTSEPRLAADTSIVRVKDTWDNGTGGCNHCIKCCNSIKCPLLDREKKQCKGYGSFYWRYFNCGRYPESEKQIQYYGCPKWEMIRQSEFR